VQEGRALFKLLSGLVVCLFKAIMTWKVLSMVAVASIAALLHYETEEDILLVDKEVVVPVTRAKAFLFIADMSNYRRVRCPLFYSFHAKCCCCFLISSLRNILQALIVK